MPELPEVETVREGVQTHAASLVIERVRILDARSTRRHVPGTADFAARLEGTRIHGVYRRGKSNTCGSRSQPPAGADAPPVSCCRMRWSYTWE